MEDDFLFERQNLYAFKVPEWIEQAADQIDNNANRYMICVHLI